LTEHTDIFEPTVSTSGGSVSNVRSLVQGQSEIATTLPGVALSAQEGEDPFEQQRDIQTLMRCESYPNLHVVQADSDITSIEDFAGKDVCAGPPGSGNLATHRKMMEMFGLEDEINRVNLSQSEASTAIRDGDIDVWFIYMSGALQNAWETADLRVVGMTDEQINQVTSEIQTLSQIQVDDSWLSGIEDPKQVLAFSSVWIVRPEFDEDHAYEICKTMVENPDTLRNSIKNAENFDDEFAAFEYGVPYHSGAEQYFQEIGVMEE
jgi:TRAP transporter TAXI family solute receptor